MMRTVLSGYIQPIVLSEMPLAIHKNQGQSIFNSAYTQYKVMLMA